MARTVSSLELTELDPHALNRIVNSPTSEQRMVNRARIILLRAEGLAQVKVATQVGVRQSVVSKWDQRFREQGLEGLQEAKRSGRKPSLPLQVRNSIIVDATQPPPHRL